ncbi:MAG: hypothetical protein A3J46_04775 [Candidatus Yanofskybacteria bacterium RIFCSPHIGHO2_02_FULL_41_11]|uniref:Uncharacterized protein n=1 Tax=Candidatus Yanofskybacteria bacterium RIFCSPHIGHO2_02_FULL_41_11 TaxID=1802675 RepID=A0A1F8FAM7_9BACT|nr:MAG: hypothetical protein A3J46_04775 [Candidatus Yanofskybacteria bacterium RIFCSPHIGHO2_02_FULL_41_11]
MVFEVRGFGNGVKVVFLGQHTNKSPNLRELKELHKSEFENVPDDQLILWVDRYGNLYLGMGHKS